MTYHVRAVPLCLVSRLRALKRDVLHDLAMVHILLASAERDTLIGIVEEAGIVIDT